MSDDFEPQSIVWVLTQPELEALLHAVGTSREVVLDLETTGLDPWAAGEPWKNGGVPARIVLASLTLPQDDDARPNVPTTWVVPLSHPDSPWLGRWRATMRDIAVAILENEKPLVNQNVKFDSRWVKAATGVDLSSRIVWDTQVGSHLLDENHSTRLKVVAPLVFEVDRWDDVDLTYPGAAEEVPMFDLGVYAARDTYWTWRLAEFQRHEMLLSEDAIGYEPESQEEVEQARLGRLAVWCSMPTVSTLTAIEQYGMVMDREWVERERDEHRAAARTLSATLAVRYPLALREDGSPLRPDDLSWAPTSHWFRDWSRAAVDAGDLRVAELTPTGKPSWSKGVLRRQARQGSEAAALLLDLRGHAKKAEFLVSWLEYVSPDGEIHTSYNVGSVVTGRLSSSEPNMQQVTAVLKPAFVPRPGFVFAELDYCLEGSMRVLTSDLRWVAVDELTVGEKVIGFPEKIGKGAGRGHNYEEAEVTSLKMIQRPSVIVKLADGRSVKCSAEHRWMSFGQGKGHGRAWVEAQNLKPGDIIPTLTEPWDEPDPVDAAYLRGFLDGEGWVSQTTTGWGQLPGVVRDEVIACSNRLGIKWRQSNHLNNGVEQHSVTTMNESLRILGMIRPHRLLPKARQTWEGRQTYGKYNTGVQVLEVLQAGEQKVVAVGTSTGTLVVEGLLSHNSQIELRVAAHISGCVPMIEAFVRGDDLHTMLAAKITGKALVDVTPEERQAGKSANFGLLYMMGAYGFREYAEDVYGVVFTMEEATLIHRAFFEMWEGMSEWHARAIKRAHDTGQVVSPIGRIRRVPSIWDGNPEVVGGAERAAVNSPVQGFASDLMQMAAASIAGRLPGSVAVPNARLVATVHDSILVEVPEADWETPVAACIGRMLDLTTVLERLDCVLTVPLAVEAGIGTRWGLKDIGVISA